MVKVPTATDYGLGQLRQTNAGTTPTQNFNTNTDMFGGLQGRKFQQAGQALEQISGLILKAEIKARQDEDLKNTLEVENAVFEWESEAKKGIEQRKLSKARGLTDDYVLAREKAISAIMKDRSFSSAAKLRMDGYLKKSAVQFENAAYDYEQAQTDAYLKSMLERRVKDNVESAAKNFMTPNKIVESMTAIRNSNKELGKRFGWTAEETKQKTQDDISDAHNAIITRMLANNMGNAAKAYLEANKDAIDGGEIAALEKAVDTGEVTEIAQKVTDAIMAKGLNQTDALKQIRKQYDGKERDEIVKRLKVRYAEEASLDKARTKQLQQSGWQKIADGQTPDNLTPQELAAAGRQVDSMWAMVTNRAQRGKGFALTSEKGVLQDYIAMEDSEIVDRDITPLQAKLTENDWNKIDKRKRDAARAVEELKRSPGMESDVNGLLYEFAPKGWGVSSAGNYTKSTSSVERAKINLFKDTMRQYLRDYVEKNKRQPTGDELRARAAQVMLSGEIDGSGIFLDDNAQFMEVLGTEDQKAFIITNPENQTRMISDATDIDEKYIPSIIEALNNADIPIQVENIKAAYEYGNTSNAK